MPRHEFYEEPVRDERKLDVVIADEVDNLFIDRLLHGTKFPGRLAGGEARRAPRNVLNSCPSL